MANVSIKGSERFESLLRRFKRAAENDKIVLQCRENMAFERETDRKTKAKKAAVKRTIKKNKIQE